MWKKKKKRKKSTKEKENLQGVKKINLLKLYSGLKKA